jgi:hypothetical protein
LNPDASAVNDPQIPHSTFVRFNEIVLNHFAYLFWRYRVKVEDVGKGNAHHLGERVIRVLRVLGIVVLDASSGVLMGLAQKSP